VTRGRNQPQVAVPLTPILDDDSNRSLAKWARAMTALNEELTLTLQESFFAVLNTLTYDVNVDADYIVSGLVLNETVICNNTSPITVTMPARVEGRQVTVVRAGTGAVTIDGNGVNIIGNATQVLPAQYDAADMIASATEWVLT
jgi:hypothetical protein